MARIAIPRYAKLSLPVVPKQEQVSRQWSDDISIGSRKHTKISPLCHIDIMRYTYGDNVKSVLQRPQNCARTV